MTSSSFVWMNTVFCRDQDYRESPASPLLWSSGLWCEGLCSVGALETAMGNLPQHLRSSFSSTTGFPLVWKSICGQPLSDLCMCAEIRFLIKFWSYYTIYNWAFSPLYFHSLRFTILNLCLVGWDSILQPSASEPPALELPSWMTYLYHTGCFGWLTAAVIISSQPQSANRCWNKPVSANRSERGATHLRSVVLAPSETCSWTLLITRQYFQPAQEANG